MFFLTCISFGAVLQSNIYMSIANLPRRPSQIVLAGQNVVHIGERMFSRIASCDENTAVFLVCHSGTAHVCLILG